MPRWLIGDGRAASCTRKSTLPKEIEPINFANASDQFLAK